MNLNNRERNRKSFPGKKSTRNQRRSARNSPLLCPVSLVRTNRCLKNFSVLGYFQFKQRLRSVAVDGKDIMAAARKAGQKSKARKEAKDAAAKEAAKREEERVAELKKTRGERWLPSLAKEKCKS